MTEHDPLCPITTWRLGEEYRERCECHLIARVRADERVALNGKLLTLYMQSGGLLNDLAAAEAVAAKLVEVICDMDDDHQIDEQALRYVRNQRDAARAEVAALREQYVVEEFIDTDGYPSMRVVKGEHVGQNEWAANIRREVLADLRAKVEGLRDEAIWARRGTVAENGLDTVPSAWHNGRTSLADAVLALIEEKEAGNG